MNVLMSIKPIYIDRIFSGDKFYEYRKRIFFDTVKSVVMYATNPTSMILGEFRVESILVATPEVIWKRTYTGGGISKELFFEYFANKKKGYAIRICDVIRYDAPINPLELPHECVIPQSFRYLKDGEYNGYKKEYY